MSQTPFVQAWDVEDQCYVVFRVSTGEEIERRTTRFKGMDEIEPIKPEPMARVAMADPLAGYR
jgi:hypothetical protein